MADFRARATIIGFGKHVTGRTGNARGTATVADAEISSATFQVSLAAIAADGKTRQPQLINSPGVSAHPVATAIIPESGFTR